MSKPFTFLVLGATGITGKHFVTKVLEEGHHVRALVRNPAKLPQAVTENPRVQVVTGSITTVVQDKLNMDALVKDADYIVAMLGDKEAQAKAMICLPFIKDHLVPAMRRNGIKRFFYQAGGFSKPADAELSWPVWALRKTIGRGYEGQHQDNDAVMEYLLKEASDIEWMNHRAGIGGDGPSKGKLQRGINKPAPSIANACDTADYNYRTVMDDAAVHTSDTSRYP